MKKVVVKNLSGEVIAGAKELDPTSWINEQIAKSDYTVEIIDITIDYNKQIEDMNRKSQGRAIRNFCEGVLDKVTGMNIAKTSAQVDAIESGYSEVLMKLKNNRPGKAYSALLLIAPDGVNVTTEEYNDIKADFESFLGI